MKIDRVDRIIINEGQNNYTFYLKDIEYQDLNKTIADIRNKLSPYMPDE